MYLNIAISYLFMCQAKEALDAGEVPIGCVFHDMKTDHILGQGRNETNETMNATRHAEIVAIDRISKNHPDLDWSTVDLYVTVEPCIMCAAALRLLGVRRVFYGTPNERFGGCGSLISAHEQYMPLERCQKLSVTVLEPFRKECVMLLRQFYLRQNDRAPKPRCKKTRILKESLL